MNSQTWSEKPRGHVEISTCITAEHLWNTIHLYVSGMLLYCQNKSCLLRIWLCLLYCCATACCKCYTFHLAEQPRRITSEPFPSATRYTHMSTRPNPYRKGAVEIATRRRRRSRVVLNLRLRARLVCFYGRGLCPNFGMGSHTGSTGIGKTANTKILVQNGNNFPRNICDTFEWKTHTYMPSVTHMKAIMIPLHL